MNMNATILGELLFFLFLLVPVFGYISYRLGIKKTTNPKTVAFVGAALSLFPLFGLIFIAVLALKSDVSK
ncbi:hypothetical protein [Pseudoalteromonas sp. MTN2-4]|uniref:hypothetical protein n=1 Tax=Pseudoalteromonas sp. MTN2-4 TaxID=3056555 RepID=UPI0036F350FF